jgi:hypothetical protein
MTVLEWNNQDNDERKMENTPFACACQIEMCEDLN